MALPSITRLADKNGDEMYAVSGGGIVRYNPRTGDWHAAITSKGVIKSRYYSTRTGAVQWIVKHQRKPSK